MSATEETREGFHLSEDGQWIPEGWNPSRISDAGTVVTGKTPAKANPHHWGDQIDFITPTDYTDSRSLIKVARKLSNEGEKAFGRQLTDAGSVAVSCIGSDMGKVILTKKRSLTNQQINTLSVNDDHCNLFWYYRLVQAYSILRSIAEGGGSTMPIVNKGQFESIQLSAPELPEQKSISAVLGSLDDKIDLLREQNETLEDLAQTLFKRWFIDFNFPDENGKPYKDSGGKMIASEFGEIPEGWTTGGVFLFAEHIKNSISPDKSPDTLYQHYSIPSFDDDMKPVLEAGSEIKSNKYEVIAPSILVSKLNPGTPRIWQIQDVEENSVCSTEFQVVKPQDQYFGFVYGALKSSPVRRELTGRAHGTSSSHQRVSPSDIFYVPFPVSSDWKLEEAFSQATLSLLTKLSENRAQAQTLTQLRDTLLPKLMKGEIRVPVTQ